MTNPPAANEPVADAAADRDAVTNRSAPGLDAGQPAEPETPDTEPRYEADYEPVAPATIDLATDLDTARAAVHGEPTEPTLAEPALVEPALVEPADPTLVEPGGQPVDDAIAPPVADPAAQPPFDQPPFDQPPFDQPPFDQPPFDQPPFGQPPFGESDSQQPPGYPPPGYQPPSGFPPPPPGAGPPFGTTFNRSDLVRPTNGRYVAGVCAAIGRATNTDPTLWRVIFAVLTLAGGISIVAYLVGWLLLPAEGDTASPLEAALGRGKSNTSPTLAVLIAVFTVLTFFLVISRNVGPAAIGLAVVIGVVALLIRGQNDKEPARIGPFGPPAPPPPPPWATVPAPPTSGAPGPDPTVNVSPPVPPFQQFPPAPMPPPPVFATQATGYRQPFAPHGPFANTSPYAASRGYPPPPPGMPVPPYPGLAPMPPKRPRPPREKSKLGRLTLSLACLAMGVMVALQVTVVNFKPSAYFAVALGVVALGLLLGAWVGRARVLILLGALLSIALAISTASVGGPDTSRPNHTENIDATPTSVGELPASYSTDLGNVHLDLSNINFVDQNVDLGVYVNVGGNAVIILPPNVDATISADITGGNCKILGRECSGLNQHEEVEDKGADGAGGGQIHLTIKVVFGNLEVSR